MRSLKEGRLEDGRVKRRGKKSAEDKLCWRGENLRVARKESWALKFNWTEDI